MNKIIIALLLSAASLNAAAVEPLGYPGVTWNTIVLSEKVNPDEPTLQMQGIVEQGVDWFYVGKGDKWKFNTYAAVTYAIDNNSGRSYTPQIGFKFNRRYENGSLDLGVRVMNHHGRSSYIADIPGSSIVKTSKGRSVQAYGTFWFDWNLKK